MEHDTYGEGRNVRGEVSFFVTYANLCFWHIDFDFFDRNGRYDHIQGPEHGGACSVNGRFEWWPQNYAARDGQICAALYINYSQLRARTCNTVHG